MFLGPTNCNHDTYHICSQYCCSELCGYGRTITERKVSILNFQMIWYALVQMAWALNS